MNFFKSLVCFLIITLSSFGFSAINEKEWVVFIKSYSNERFCINFPNDPEFFNKPSEGNEKKTFVARASQAGINYTLEVSPNNKENYLGKMLDKIKQNQDLEIVDYSISNQTANWNNKILDLACVDHKKSQTEKIRMIFTKNNIYQLHTVFNSSEKNDHNYFINSFFIANS
jgi:hypothetical protein